MAPASCDADAGRQRRQRTASRDRVRTGAAGRRRRRRHAVEIVLIVGAGFRVDAELTERTVAQLHGIAIAPVDAEHDVAAAVGHVGAERQRSRAQLAVSLAVLRHVVVQVHAFVVGPENEVDCASDCIRAVNRGRAAGNDVDSLDQRSRNRRSVHQAVEVVRRGALAVDQHQVALRTEAAQVDRCRTCRAVVRILTVTRNGDGQDAQDLLDFRLQLRLDFRCADREDRAR